MGVFTALSTHIRAAREHVEQSGIRSIEWLPETLDTYDAALICTDHDGVNYYDALVRSCPLVVDTRNVIRDAEIAHKCIVKA